LGPWERSTLQNLQRNAKFHNRKFFKTRTKIQVTYLRALSQALVPYPGYYHGDQARLCLRAGWHAQPGEEADSPSVGIADDAHAQGESLTKRGETSQNPPSAADTSPDLGQAKGQGNARDGVVAEHSVSENALLDPLPASPGGLAPADLLEHEKPAAGESDLIGRWVRLLISDTLYLG
jgi:hypothetical protein